MKGTLSDWRLVVSIFVVLCAGIGEPKEQAYSKASRCLAPYQAADKADAAAAEEEKKARKSRSA
jgi:hypothetical protein